MSIYKIFNSTLLILLVLLMGSCSQKDLLTYQEDARIYFERSQVVNYTFSTKDNGFTRDTLYIPLRIMGSSVKNDRAFNILLDDSSTAKRGYHFELGAQVVAADSFSRLLPVYLYRRPGLKDSVVTAYLSIGESADFKKGYADKYLTTDSITKLQYRISINDQLLKPVRWDTYWVNYFGAYSRTKHLFIIQASGNPNWEATVFPQDLNFLTQTVKFALYNYEQANGPLIDENGQRVIFP